MLLFGAVVVIGSVMPWATAFGGALSKAGTDGDGAITLVLGLLIAAGGLAVGLARGRIWIAIVAALLGALVGVTAGIDLSDAQSKIGDLHGVVSVGAGLWVTLFGGILAFGACCAAVALRRDDG